MTENSPGESSFQAEAQHLVYKYLSSLLEFSNWKVKVTGSNIITVAIEEGSFGKVAIMATTLTNAFMFKVTQRGIGGRVRLTVYHEIDKRIE